MILDHDTRASSSSRVSLTVGPRASRGTTVLDNNHALLADEYGGLPSRLYWENKQASLPPKGAPSPSR